MWNMAWGQTAWGSKDTSAEAVPHSLGLMKFTRMIQNSDRIKYY